jgi:hypothetical protein
MLCDMLTQVQTKKKRSYLLCAMCIVQEKIEKVPFFSVGCTSNKAGTITEQRVCALFRTYVGYTENCIA